MLRSITSDFALEDWNLLATVLELDANVFLLGNDGVALLKQLLDAITKASTSESWPEIQDKVVSTVLVPLMRDFAKARDLTGFIRHWYSQLLAYEERRRDHEEDTFSAWEDEALQVELGKLMEATLTIPQILQILDWLAEEVIQHPDAVCVILEAIARSLSGEEHVVDAVGLRLYHIMFDSSVADRLKTRYTWRRWRILSYTLKWIEYWDVEKLAALWDENAKPFDSLLRFANSKTLLGSGSNQTSNIEAMEVLRFACNAWTASKKGKENKIQELDKPILLGLLRGLAADVKLFVADLEGDVDVGTELYDSNMNTLNRGKAWLIWSAAHCVFVEHPEVLR